MSLDTVTTNHRNEIRTLIADALDVTEDQVEQAGTFRDGLGADSLTLIDLQGRLERYFDVEIPNEQADLMVDLDSTCTTVLTIVAAAASR